MFCLHRNPPRTTQTVATRDNEIAPVVATSTVVVHVVGKVASPGVVELPAGSRVPRCRGGRGGGTSSRASSTVNLARLVVDGEQIDVGADPRASGGTSRISLNSADAQQLQQLPGRGTGHCRTHCCVAKHQRAVFDRLPNSAKSPA